MFAGLYTAVFAGIAEMRPGSLVDAFFFSVETLATVGYGHMYPVTLAGHLVATAKIVLGMFGMAVITGLIFVRFGERFVEIYTEVAGSGQCVVDYGRLHETEPAVERGPITYD